MSLHAWHHQGPHKPSSCATLRSTLTGAELPQAKNALHLCIQGRFSPVQLFAALQTVACQASLSGKGVLQARILDVLANTGCRSLLEHYVSCCPSCQLSRVLEGCQNPRNPSSCTTSTPGPHRGKPKSSRAASRANPSGRPMCRGGNKTTTETQGQCG